MELQHRPPEKPLTVETAVSQSLSTTSKELSKTLLTEEQRVLALKYKSKRIRELTPDELVAHTQGLCFKTCIITGWQMPELKEYVNVFEDQLRKFLVDEYLNLNIDEFEYAMRVFGTQIKDWGKSLNLSLIREALDTYLAKRADLSKMEEQKAVESIPEAPPQPVDWSEMWEKLKSGEISGKWLDLVPYAAIYDWLEKTGHIVPKNRDKWRWMVRACSQEVNRLAILRDTFQATPDDKEMLELLKNYKWEQGRFPTEQKMLSHLIAPAKTVAVIEKLNEK